LAHIGQLFAHAKIDEALARLDTPTLSGSAEGAFARAVILSYTPFVDLSRPAVMRLLREAADQRMPAAQILLGWSLQLDPACSGCRDEARGWFRRALRQTEDRDARLGLALSWSSAGAFHATNEQLEILLADPLVDDVRALALAFRISTAHPRLKEAFLKESAEQGWAEAQLQYAMRYLDLSTPHAQLWIAMAAAQGHAEAAKLANQLHIQPDLRLEAQRRLLVMASSAAVAIGKAAEWCARLSRESDDERCRLHALENHFSCRLPKSTTAALGIDDFERTEIYGACRLRQLSAGP
jgi:hypothetical protein